MGTDYISFLFQIMACFLLSACIGVERQYRRRNVGLRTIILVSLGSFLFVRFSFAFPKSDMTRVAAQVVAGIGFLGAGVIIKDDKSVKGLTTAATLWCSAAIGILCSANLIFEAAIGTALILFTNIILRSVNSKINFLSGNVNYNLYHYTIVCDEKNDSSLLKIIKEIVRKYKISIKSLETNDLEDLVSIGTIGLIKGVNTYQNDKNIKLATYASRCIDNEILMYLRKTKRKRTEVSFEDSLSFDSEGNELHLEDVLGTDDDIVTKPIEEELDKYMMYQEVSKLEDRDREIIELRYGLNGKKEMTQKEVANLLGISQSYISRIEKKVIKKISSIIKL